MQIQHRDRLCWHLLASDDPGLLCQPSPAQIYIPGTFGYSPGGRWTLWWAKELAQQQKKLLPHFPRPGQGWIWYPISRRLPHDLLYRWFQYPRSTYIMRPCGYFCGGTGRCCTCVLAPYKSGCLKGQSLPVWGSQCWCFKLSLQSPPSPPWGWNKYEYVGIWMWEIKESYPQLQKAMYFTEANNSNANLFQ